MPWNTTVSLDNYAPDLKGQPVNNIYFSGSTSGGYQDLS